MTSYSTNNQGKVPSALATGGSGYAYEQQVGAMYLALLLLQGIPAIFPDCQVEKVAFQTRRIGWETDDLLVLCSGTLGKQRKLAIQIKRQFAARASSEDFVETVQRFWGDFNAAARFVPGNDVLVVATSSTSEVLQLGFGQLVDCARSASDGADFTNRLETPGLHSKKARECREIIRAIIEEAESPSPSEEGLWRFIKSLYLHILDLSSSTSQQEAWIKNALTQSAVGPDAVGTAENSWRHLVEIATHSAASAKTLTRSDLPDSLLSQHNASQTPQVILAKLAEHSAVTLEGIRSTVSGMEDSLQRKDQLAAIFKAMHANRVVVLSGTSGSGKSALAKTAVERQARELTVLSFRSEEFAVSHLDNVFYGDTTASQVETLLGAQQGVLIHIESLERLLEHSTRDGFNDLIRLVERTRNIRLLITCRDYAEATVMAAFFRRSELQHEVIEVPPLTDEEMAEVVDALPDLSAPLSNNSLNRLLRNPYMLDKAASMNWSNELEMPSNERAFRRRCWNEVIRRDDLTSEGMPDRRGKTLVALALRRARELRPFVLVDDLDAIAFDSLCKDGIVAKNEEGLAAPSHDVLEDWAIAYWIDSLVAKYDWRVSEIATSVGGYPAIRRGFRKWLTEALEYEADRTERFAVSACDDASLSNHFRDDILISVLLSNSARQFIARQKKKLLDNDAELLVRLIHLLRVVCKQPLRWMSDGGATTSGLLEPVGEAWPVVLEIVADELDRLLPNHIGLIVGLIEDWARGVTWQSPQPEGSTAVGNIAFRLLDHLDGYTSKDSRKRVLKIIAQVPRADEAQFTDLIERATAKKSRGDSTLDDFAEILLIGTMSGSASRDFPEQLARLMLSRWLLSDTDVEEAMQRDPYYLHQVSSRLGVEGSFGLRGHLDLKFSNQSAIQGPFLRLLREHPMVGVKLILQMLNHSGTWYGERKWSINNLETAYRTKISISDYGEIEQWANLRLWVAYRGTSVAPNVIQCALMALESWLLELCKLEVDIEPWLMYILKKSNNVMPTAVVASICNAHPEKSGEAALALLTSREAIQMDLRRSVQEMDAKNLTRFTHLSFDPMAKVYAKERDHSNSLEHRGHHLETLACKLQFGGKAEEVWQIIDAHRSQIPPEEMRTDEDRTWLLALHRMDTRRFEFTEVSPEIEDVGSEIKNERRIVVAADVNKMETDIQEFLHTSDKEMQPVHQGIELMNWAIEQWAHGYDNEESDSWRNALDRAKEALDKTPSFLDEAPTRVVAVCVRDHWEDLDAADREWCLSLLVKEIGVGDDWDDSFMPIQGIPLTGDIMRPDGFSAYVLPRILVSDPDNSEVLGVLAKALTHSSEQVVFNAAQGVIEYLQNGDHEFVIRCAGAIALKANILENRARLQREEAKQSYRPRQERGVIGNTLQELRTALASLLPVQRQEDDPITKSASVLTRELFLKGSIDAEHELNILNPTSGYGTLAVKSILEILARMPESTTSKQFFAKLANSIAADWASRDKIGYERELDLLNRLAGFVLTSHTEESIHCCQPFLDAVDEHSDKVAIFIECLIGQEDSIPPRGKSRFWDVWQAFAQRISSASWLPQMYGRHSNGAELVNKMLLSTHWKENVRHWQRLDGHEHEIGELAANLPSTPVVMGAYTHFLHAIGEKALPDAFTTVAKILNRAEQSQDLLGNGNTVFYLESLLGRYVHGQPKNLKSDASMRAAVLTILDCLVDAGSSAAYRMRDDFITPA